MPFNDKLLLTLTVDCVWGEFVFGECDAPCGEGIQIGKRPILQPALYGGKPCEGSDTTTKKCNSDPDAGEYGYLQVKLHTS